MQRRLLLLSVPIWPLTGCALPQANPVREFLVAQVTATERAFAKSMADRDFMAFAAHVADDAVFLNGGQPLPGKAAVLAHWQRFFAGAKAPFSWQPDMVEVSGSGNLAQSIGPVADPQGVVVARFYSTWRLEPAGLWRIVFDNGYDLPPAAP